MTTSVLAQVFVAPLRLYQRFISPALPANCRFYPTCSVYAVEALQVHGAFRGTWLSMRRVGRCHPWHAGGVDPVPPRRERPAAVVSSPAVKSLPASPVTIPCQAPDVPQDFDPPDARPATAEAPTPRSNAA